MPSKSQIIKDVRNFIAKDEILSALKLLREAISFDKTYDEIIILTARKYRIEREVRMGTVSFDQASISRNQLISAVLEICRSLEVSLESNPTLPQSLTPNTYELSAYPRGPMVEGHLINEKIVESYAKIIRPERAMMHIEKANRLRKEADPGDDTVTIIEPYTLLSPTNSRPLDFWLDAFHEARLHGPRMLGALLLALPESQLSPEVKDLIENLRGQLKTIP